MPDINSFHPPNAFPGAIARLEGFKAEKWSNLPRITQLVAGRVKFQMWRIWLQTPSPHTALTRAHPREHTTFSGYLIGVEWKNKK